MTGRAYMGKVLNQVWLKYTKKLINLTSELLDKQVNAQKESLIKNYWFPQAQEKVCNENERRKKNERLKYF